MTEDALIRHCAPTLAGIKTGNLFTCTYDSRETLLESLRQLNRKLSGKGLRLLPLRFSSQKALIYVYRPDKLRRDLSQEIAAPLQNSGWW